MTTKRRTGSSLKGTSEFGDILEKGERILSHESDGWELAPKFIVDYFSESKNVFRKFTFYENGIDFEYKSGDTIFIEYSEIEFVCINKADEVHKFSEGERIPAWVSVIIPNKIIRTYHSYSLPVEEIRNIFKNKGVKIENKYVDNYGQIHDKE